MTTSSGNKNVNRFMVQTGLPDNAYASITKDRLKLSRDKAAPEQESVQQLRRIIESQLRQVRIERLLLEVNDLQFTYF
jgi:hypothetical protein